ncbi:MAG: hypothetical protein FE78DRAFT_66127, partial [Acidomyces sp. 'richmondensis']
CPDRLGTATCTPARGGAAPLAGAWSAAGVGLPVQAVHPGLTTHTVPAAATRMHERASVAQATPPADGTHDHVATAATPCPRVPRVGVSAGGVDDVWPAASAGARRLPRVDRNGGGVAISWRRRGGVAAASASSFGLLVGRCSSLPGRGRRFSARYQKLECVLQSPTCPKLILPPPLRPQLERVE